MILDPDITPPFRPPYRGCDATRTDHYERATQLIVFILSRIQQRGSSTHTQPPNARVASRVVSTCGPRILISPRVAHTRDVGPHYTVNQSNFTAIDHQAARTQATLSTVGHCQIYVMIDIDRPTITPELKEHESDSEVEIADWSIYAD